ncbi:MAG TPA: hypothetical protein VLA32_08280 [Anaerolineales bacterium]|jgi:hypothetical protein|nr:hypothetical protein [Anaerolineales bacterium]
MERTVPEVVSEEIELYLRTAYSLLRASTEVRLRSLEEAHAGMNSLLHPLARHRVVDSSAFVYSILRLPQVITQVNLVVLGQTYEMFQEYEIEESQDWHEVRAPARRRRCFYNGTDILACLITSRSDIDDLIPILTAYQIEWNKMNSLMQQVPEEIEIAGLANNPAGLAVVAEVLGLDDEDMERLMSIWGADFEANLERVSRHRMDLKVRLLDGSLNEYRRAIHRWWHRIVTLNPAISTQPVYFVSSNSHSLVNLVTGFALDHEDDLLSFLEDSTDLNLKQEWEKIQADVVPSSRENFFYYLLKKVQNTPEGQRLIRMRAEWEKACSILRSESKHNFDLESQLIPLSQLNPDRMDPRLTGDYADILKESDALILNIDYPLGLAAYQVLTEVAENVGSVLGIYIIGKAATLNGVVGDVMIPNVVYDGQSLNTFLFSNCFRGPDVAPYLVYGTALDNQKAVTVLGTFLQNVDYMDVFYREGYTDIEMEGGPYLSAIYEMTRPKRHPLNEVVNLYDLPFDLGVLHYASDKPLSKGKNLGSASLSYFGMDPTYATGVAVLKRIFQVEETRLRLRKG